MNDYMHNSSNLNRVCIDNFIQNFLFKMIIPSDSKHTHKNIDLSLFSETINSNIT